MVKTSKADNLNRNSVGVGQIRIHEFACINTQGRCWYTFENSITFDHIEYLSIFSAFIFKEKYTYIPVDNKKYQS